MDKYIDSNIFIFTILEEGSRKDNSITQLKKIIDGKDNGFTSVLTLDEVLWVLWKETKDREFAIENTEKILQIPNLKILGTNVLDFTTSISLLKKYTKLKPRDAMHASISKNNNIFNIVSDDKDLDKIEWVKRITI